LGRRPLATGELSAFFRHAWLFRFLVLVFMARTHSPRGSSSLW
jgi:hypothetical protein